MYWFLILSIHRFITAFSRPVLPSKHDTYVRSLNCTRIHHTSVDSATAEKDLSDYFSSMNPPYKFDYEYVQQGFIFTEREEAVPTASSRAGVASAMRDDVIDDDNDIDDDTNAVSPFIQHEYLELRVYQLLRFDRVHDLSSIDPVRGIHWLVQVDGLALERGMGGNGRESEENGTCFRATSKIFQTSARTLMVSYKGTVIERDISIKYIIRWILLSQMTATIHRAWEDAKSSNGSSYEYDMTGIVYRYLDQKTWEIDSDEHTLTLYPTILYVIWCGCKPETQHHQHDNHWMIIILTVTMMLVPFRRGDPTTSSNKISHVQNVERPCIGV